MNTLEDLLRRLTRRENLQITPLNRSGTAAPGLSQWRPQSPDYSTKDPSLPIIPGTKDRMPGAFPYGEQQINEDRSKGGKWRRKELRRFFKKMEGVI